jgi:hypothetical protein
MDLLQHLRKKRAKQRKKQPFGLGVFNITNGLVKAYGLRQSFLDLLDNPEDFLAREHLKSPRIKTKNHLEIPLFSVSTKEEYLLTKAIIEKVNNPYLQFAYSPGEILLCTPLHALNPTLSSGKLRRYHFETLLLCEHAREHVRELTKEAEEISRTVGAESKDDNSENEPSRLDTIQKRVERLETFLAKVENFAAKSEW